MPSAALIPELVDLADRVIKVVHDVRGRATQVASGADVELAAAAADRADDVLADVVRETRILVVTETTARNKLTYALQHAQAEEKELRETALALDRRKKEDPEAIAFMSRAQSRRRDAEQLAAELAEAEARVGQVEAFYQSVLASQEDVNRTVAALRRRYAAAERLAALTELTGRIQERLAGVAELRDRVDSVQAEAEAGWSVAPLDPGTQAFLAQGRRRQGEAADELARYREG